MFHQQVSGKCDNAGGTYIGRSQLKMDETATFVLLLAAVPFSSYPVDRNIMCVLPLPFGAAVNQCLFRCNTAVLLHCCCCCGSGSTLSLATGYLVPVGVGTSISECGMPAACCSMDIMSRSVETCRPC